MIEVAPNYLERESLFQRLKTKTRSHSGRCPGLLHFAPLALATQVLTQTLSRCGLLDMHPRCGRIHPISRYLILLFEALRGTRVDHFMDHSTAN